MPEGDSVRRAAVRLHRALAGREIVRAELRWAELGGVDLAGRTVTEVCAYGKRLLIRIAPAPPPPRGACQMGGVMPSTSEARTEPLTLHSHLRMDGRWLVRATASSHWPAASDPDIRAILANREWTAVGHLLGELDLVPTAGEQRLLGHLGPDLMADDFPSEGLPRALAAIAAVPRRTIGATLLDQRMVAGIGTIFMSEALFRRRASPWTATVDVDVATLLDVARTLLLSSAQITGPVSSGPDGQPGPRIYVHARAGRRCHRCGAVIRVAPVGEPPYERPAFYCPGCQQGPRPPAGR